jgi:flagellar biogenesis protein FliO
LTGDDRSGENREEQKAMEDNPTSLGSAQLETAWTTALKEVWGRARRALGPRKTRRLRVRETLSLGDKRFLAVIEFDHQEFLVGGSGNSFALVARLHEGMVINEPPLPTETRVA